MADEKPVLSDPDRYPDDKLIHACLGKRKTALWIAFFTSLHDQHPNLSEEWRYYKDGHNWLMKVTKKSKTIFWLSVWKNGFKITFYLSDKADEAIATSNLSGELKESFKTGKRYGKIRGITIDFSKKQDIEQADILIGIRRKL